MCLKRNHNIVIVVQLIFRGKVMSFGKIRTIKVSERVFDIVCEELDILQSEYNKKISGYLSCFNNCREQGFYLSVSTTDFNDDKRTKEEMYIWACESRNSDNIMVVISHKYPSNKGMFDETAYENRKLFSYNELQESADYILNAIKDHFRHELH